jgi:geranylgeranyl pyrophosphate synthase
MLRRLDAPVEVRDRAAARLLTDTLKVIDGQEREFALRRSASPTLAEYQAMVEGKTSALFALPLAGAAEVCGAAPVLVDGLATAAGHLGVLFQVQDDVLDVWGEKGRGQRGSDIAEGKRSFLVVHALQHGAPADAEWLRDVLDRPRELTTTADVEAAAALLERTGARDAALRELRRRAALAAAVPAVAGHAGLHALVAGLADVFCAPVGHLERLETAA